jgi:predicted metalloprotease
MKYDEGYRSDDVEDRRGRGGGGMRLGLGGFLVVGVLSLVFRTNLFALLGAGGASGSSRPSVPPANQDKLVSFVSFVLDDVQATWTRELPKSGVRYERAKLVLFTDTTPTGGCGLGDLAMGPFYCPGDQKVYIDLGFYRELQGRLGAPGDFAEAYVIAHEIGHHVQKLLGTEEKVRASQRDRASQKNELSVRMELQADCYAGIWAHSTSQRQLLNAGDIEEALGAAAAVGDDRLQKQAGAAVNPERWTHGSSAQRVSWFKKGLAGGKVESCDTFGVARP